MRPPWLTGSHRPQVRVADSHVRHMRLLRKARGEPVTGASLDAAQLRKMLEVVDNSVCPSSR